MELIATKPKTDKDYETIRRYLIVQMNSAGVEKLQIARTLTDVRRKLSKEQRKVIAGVISSKEHRPVDISHDLMGIMYDPMPEHFLPRIKEIQEVF